MTGPDPEGGMAARRRPRPMPIGWMTLVIAVVLYVAGSNIGSGWVVILTAALVGGVALDLLVVWRTDRSTTTDLRLGGTADMTSGTSMRLVVQRPDLGTSLHVGDVSEDLRIVVRTGSADVRAKIVPARGHHDLLRTVLRTIGPLGLAHASRVVTTDTDLWCRPCTLPADGRVQLLMGRAGSDAVRSVRAGDEEIRGVRDHQAGDPRRSVHWRATARHGTLMVRQAESTHGGRLRLGIDGGVWTAPALDLATVLCASLADTATRLGHTAEIEADGTLRLWSEDTHHSLAALPPAAGLTARPLAGIDGTAAVMLRPSGAGVLVEGPTVVRAVLADMSEVTAWLREG